MKIYRPTERILPEKTSGGSFATHLKRYDFARQFCKGKVILDSACGVGYGTYCLAEVAREVVGIDISYEAIAYAKKNYQKENVIFGVMDVHRLEFPSEKFDIVCSFETIEHIANPREFLVQVKRVLKKDGIFIVSTPNAKKTNYKPKNPYHLIEYSRKDFESLLKDFFDNVEIYGERRIQSNFHYYIQKIDIFNIRSRLPSCICRNLSHLVDTKSWDEVGLSELIIDSRKLSRATELIVICSNKKSI